MQQVARRWAVLTVLQIFSKLLKSCLQFISKWAKEMAFSTGAVIQGIAINGKIERIQQVAQGCIT